MNQCIADFHALAEWLQKYPGLAPEARTQVLAVDVLRECEGVARLLMRQPPLVVGYTSQNQVAPMGPISAGNMANLFQTIQWDLLSFRLISFI